ncbi:DUF4397 domain-containing protein [uncultured Amnibacterium sp.]|uniref:DUF4397 domain-containing protein n=1 Tax=uncultured Amnibacterium sp. TaxID=1631851 RepID=UPI0035CAE125
MPTSRIRIAVVAVAIAVLALVAVPTSAVAATPTGWVRVAHLSPDTRPVDVRLASLGGSSKVLAVDDVSYGAVSKYLPLPVGNYAVAMRPAGGSASSTPVVQTFVTVTAGRAATVAVFGTNADLKTKVIDDSLTLPKSGKARVRVVQASTAAAPVTVTAAPATTIVSDATTTTVSPYADVTAGTWKLTAVGGTKTTTATVALEAGQIASVLVLDDASGGIVLRRVLDSASVGGVPKGYLATGGGYLAHQADQRRELILTAGGLGLLAAAGLVTGVAVRRRARA